MNKEEWLSSVARLILAEFSLRGYYVDNKNVYVRPTIHKGNTMGLISYKKHLPYDFIYVSDYERDVERVVYTVYHEICHFIAFNSFNCKGHGKKWKELMREFGAPDKAKSNLKEEYNNTFMSFITNILAQVPKYEFIDYIVLPKIAINKNVTRKKLTNQLDLIDYINEIEFKEGTTVTVSVTHPISTSNTLAIITPRIASN